MENKKLLLDFLQSQRLLVLASIDEEGKPYVSNLFMGVDDNFKIYFISSEDTRHSRQIDSNSNIAFSTVWFDKNDHTDRKGIQGQGICCIANSDKEVETGVKLHNDKYPEFKDRITKEWIKSKNNKSYVWVIEPIYIKYWDDENFGDEEIKEFNF